MFLFLPVILIGYFWLLHKRLVLGSKVWLVGGSLFFYGYWNIIYIPLLLISIFVNFSVGSAMSDAPQEQRKAKLLKTFSSKQLLWFGIFFNIGLLAYFKYTDFFLINFNGIFGSNIPLLHIILPLGISFFTFTQIAFLVDAYKREVKEYDLLHYMLFVTYFPHLLAGPILHHKEMMPQFANKWNFAIRWKNVASGLFLFSIGLFKKVIIADFFADYANYFYADTISLDMLQAWAASFTYTLQLYFDFSGYTDMAIGVSLLFNIKLPINFNSPYKATSIQDFWRRWHMTLSRFLRDYIYIPLGGNRHGGVRTSLNLMATFIIGGIWHGAGWTYVFWGFLHGVALVINHIWKSLGLKLPMLVAWFLTFNFVNIAWVFFRAPTWDDAVNVFTTMFDFSGFDLNDIYDSSVYWQVMIGIIMVLVLKNSNEWAKIQKATLKYQLFTTLLLAVGILYLSKVSEFIYFQF
jgi:D-alanyl-lipoteichoic acid acyltransferase DltB (MBOAT superfamily)